MYHDNNMAIIGIPHTDKDGQCHSCVNGSRIGGLLRHGGSLKPKPQKPSKGESLTMLGT